MRGIASVNVGRFQSNRVKREGESFVIKPRHHKIGSGVGGAGQASPPKVLRRASGAWSSDICFWGGEQQAHQYLRRNRGKKRENVH